MIGFILGCFVGGIIAVVVMSLCFAAKMQDEDT